MGYIRLITTAIALVLFFLIGIPISAVIWIVGKIDPEKRERLASSYVNWGLAFVGAATGSKVEVIGRENLNTGEPALFVANHSSMFDLVFLLPVLPLVTRVVAKQELGKVPFLAFWMRQIKCFMLDRKNLEQGVKMVQEETENIKAGKNVLIFPEGTRTKKEGEFLDFHGGSFKIAIRTNAPVVPISIIGTGDIFENHMPTIKRSDVKIVVGEAVPTRGIAIAERKTLPDRCKTVIAENYKNNK